MAVQTEKPRISILNALFRRAEQSVSQQIQPEVEIVAPVQRIKRKEPDLSGPFAWRRRIDVSFQSGNLVRTKDGHSFEIDSGGKAFGKTVYSLTKEDLK